MDPTTQQGTKFSRFVDELLTIDLTNPISWPLWLWLVLLVGWEQSKSLTKMCNCSAAVEMRLQEPVSHAFSTTTTPAKCAQPFRVFSTIST